VLGTIVLAGVIVYIYHQYKTPSFQAQVQTAAVSDARISYYTRGSGKPLILINGFGMTMQDWDPLLLEKLSQNHTLILFDDRGVGNSTGDISHLTESQMADDTIGLMDALRIQKADILGWSFGSFTAQIIAEQHPNRIDHLILVATAPDVNHMIFGSNLNNTALNNVDADWNSGFVPLMFAKNANAQAYLTRLATAITTGEAPHDTPESAAVRTAQEQTWADQNQEQSRYDKLPSITSPTLIIAGDKDTVVLPANDTLVANRIPNAKLVIIPNAGHAVLFEDPKQFSETVEEFLEK